MYPGTAGADPVRASTLLQRGYDVGSDALNLGPAELQACRRRKALAAVARLGICQPGPRAFQRMLSFSYESLGLRRVADGPATPRRRKLVPAIGELTRPNAQPRVRAQQPIPQEGAIPAFQIRTGTGYRLGPRGQISGEPPIVSSLSSFLANIRLYRSTAP